MTELYINGVKMALKPGEIIATTIQANDLLKPDTVQSSFTNTFQVVATAATREALGFAEDIGSSTDTPYTKLDAQVIADGREILPFGVGELVGHEESSFEISVYSGVISFFDLLGDKKIAELDLSDFDHSWTFANILPNTANTENFIYDLIDRGLYMDLAGVDCFDLYPSIFGKLIFDRIFSEHGFKYIGLGSSEIFNRLLLPAIRKPAYSDSFIAERTTNAGTAAGEFNTINDFEGNAYFDTVAAWDYTDGAAGLFSTGAGEYIADAPMYVNAEARLMAKIGCIGGRVYFSLSIFKNSTKIAENKQSFKGGVLNPTQARGTTYSVSAANVYMLPGDVLKVVVKFWGEDLTLNPLARPRCEISYATNYPGDDINNQGQDYFRITPAKTFPQAGTMRLNDVLPDIKQRDFIKFILQLHNAFPKIDSYSNSIEIIEFNTIESNTSRALDWTNKLSKRLDLNYKFGDFGQQNFIKWKEHELTTPANFGNGFIICDNKNLPEENEMITFPFSASGYSHNFPGLAYIPIWKYVTSTNPYEFEQQDVGERVLIQSRQKASYMLSAGVRSGEILLGHTYIVFGYYKVIYNEVEYYPGNTFTGQQDPEGKLITDYAADGVGKVLDTDFGNIVNAPISAFYQPGQPESLNAEKYIIRKYYPAFAGILNQTKFFKALVRLDASDIESYDPSIPVWLEQYAHYFYVNKISEYQAGKLTEVEFIRL